MNGGVILLWTEAVFMAGMAAGFWVRGSGE